MKHIIRAYYGPGGRKNGKGRVGEREGDLAIHVWNSTDVGFQVELDILKKREDIGIIEVWNEEE